MIYRFSILKIGTLLILLISATTHAASNIDPNESFAWSENSGWFNFSPDNAIGVEVTDTHLNGFIWAENIGWIKLGTDIGGPYTNTSATNWGVNRANNGALSGFAWSENVGWINFDQVTVDAVSGNFDGYAWSENIGWIHLRNASPTYGVRYFINNSGNDPIFQDHFE